MAWFRQSGGFGWQVASLSGTGRRPWGSRVDSAWSTWTPCWRGL